jgi:phosphatidate cytidylyltransferase
MITNQLSKRILTSIVLVFFAYYCIVINTYIFLSALFLMSIICFIEWNNINIKTFSKKKNNKMFAIRFFGLIYLLIFITSSYLIYSNVGPNYYILLLLICSSSDIGGYLVGRTIGGTKLTKISPNKTISGSIGSLIFSLIPVLLINKQDYLLLEFPFTIENIFLCLLISVSCQLGDLIISFFKRINNIKNTGNMLPGHGGILDRVDGIIFAIPVLVILKYFLNI